MCNIIFEPLAASFFSPSVTESAFGSTTPPTATFISTDLHILVASLCNLIRPDIVTAVCAEI
jgi:hypothetical protein